MKIGPNQALQNRIQDLELNSKNSYKGKIQAFEAKLGLFWEHFGTFWNFVVIFMKMEEKASVDISYIRGPESIKDMHMIHCKCPNGAQQ